ncbi:hypothetical protein [Undibacterium sp. SXout20W]|uniref:hypothetical protein n=1 Tax=Undibacterium sp. SXout20W TaxID=3413051 RepID=UPI003BF25C3D
MTWTNPLDKVPQIPQDYANHFIYGQALFLIVLLILSRLHVLHSVAIAFAVLTVVSAGKKIVDYFKEGETLSMCVGKALVTIAGGILPYLCLILAHIT